MSIQRKVLLTLIALFAVLTALHGYLLHVVVGSGFAQLEQRQVDATVKRIQRALQQELTDLSRHNRDWAYWDDTWHFAEQRDPAYVKANLVPSTWETLDLEVILYFDVKGQLFAGQLLLLPELTPIALDDLIPGGLPPTHPLLARPDPMAGASGFIASTHGPMWITAEPILTSTQQGPNHGTLIMGRLLTAERLEALGHQLDLSLTLQPIAPVDEEQVAADQTLWVQTVVTDLRGNLLFKLLAALPQEATTLGREVTTYALELMVLTGIVVLAATLLWLRLMVLRPVEQLTRHVQRMAETGDLATAPPELGDDEFGRLEGEFRRMQERVAMLANYDVLTGLPNRALFGERSAMALSLVQRRGIQVAVLFIDLDGFKPINDSLGHSVGDHLLKAVAERLRTHLRGHDTLARYGGDEFVVLMEDAAEDSAAALAAKLVHLCAEPFEVDEQVLLLSASIGIALAPTDANSVETLLHAADEAMYQAKALGKGRFCFYRPQHGTPTPPREG